MVLRAIRNDIFQSFKKPIFAGPVTGLALSRVAKSPQWGSVRSEAFPNNGERPKGG
jgi:hypothetical protein